MENTQSGERKDLLKFAAFRRDEKGRSPHTVYNKFRNGMHFAVEILGQSHFGL